MSRKIEWSIRNTAYEQLLNGIPTEQVASEVGVARRTVDQWARLAGMTFKPSSGGGIDLQPVTPPVPDASRGYRRLTLEDRAFIEATLAGPLKWSARRIAEHLDVAPSTITREIHRHEIQHGHGRHVTGKERHYSAGVAHQRAMQVQHRPRGTKLESRWVLRGKVLSQLNDKHSPQQVAQRLRFEFPDDPEMRVSHETIYQALYVQGKGALRHELTVEKALRSGRTGRIPQSKLSRRSSKPWLDGAMITQRPSETDGRAVPGHWEGDLVVGPENSGIVTLVERQTRCCLIGRLPGMRDSETVIDVMQDLVQTLPGELLRSVTWDQGSEMAKHWHFTGATGCSVFFCDPHSPWQRGSNENLNGLIRDFYPKGTNFNTVTDANLAEMQRLLNDRPRETLGWQTPREKLTELMTGVALAL